MANENNDASIKQDKPVKKEKPIKLDRNGKPKKSIGQKIKGLFGELKKVSWPTPAKVATQTCVVLVVALVFLLLLLGMDTGLQALYRLLTGGLSGGATELASFSQSFGDIAKNSISFLTQLPKIL